MTDDTLQHRHLNGIEDYTAALDTLCRLARHNLYLFDKDYEGLGFNAEIRYTVLRNFLLANPINRLYILAHDVQYLATRCPRMTLLLRQFDSSMFIHQSAAHMQHHTEPFSVADSAHYVRRFHFDDPHGLLAHNDPTNARKLESLYREMWENSSQAIHTTHLGL